MAKIDSSDCRVLIWRQILQRRSLQKCCCGKFMKPKGMYQNRSSSIGLPTQNAQCGSACRWSRTPRRAPKGSQVQILF